MRQNPDNDHYLEIYRTQAAAYHHMIAAEDVDGNLLPALQTAVNMSRKRVLDLGSGTGRIPILLDGIAGQVVGLDLQLAMLAENRQLIQILVIKLRQYVPGFGLDHPEILDQAGLVQPVAQ